MSDKSLTLLELHLDESRIQLGPKTISTGGSPSGDDEGAVDVIDSEADSESGAEPDESRFRSTEKAALGLLLVASLALAAWKLLGEEDLEAVEELDELTD